MSTPGRDVRVCVVVPALNPGRKLLGVVEDLFEAALARGISLEVIVVDDGCSDGSIDRLLPREGLIVLRGRNHGKGAALRAGLATSAAPLRGFIDADGAYRADSLLAMARVLEDGDFDIVIGRRYGAPRSLARVLGTLAFSTWVQLWCGIDVDTQAGCKMFRGALLDEILPACSVDGFAIDVELLSLSRQKGWQGPVSVPVQLVDETGSSTVTLKRVLGAFMAVARLATPRPRRGQWGVRSKVHDRRTRTP